MSSGDRGFGDAENPQHCNLSLGLISFELDGRLVLHKYYHVLSFAVCGLVVDGVVAVGGSFVSGGGRGSSIRTFFASRMQVLRDDTTVP